MIVVFLYSVFQNDDIVSIKRGILGIEEIEANQKIEISEDGTKYITEKSMEEKLRENLITQEEYDNYIIQIKYL